MGIYLDETIVTLTKAAEQGRKSIVSDRPPSLSFSPSGGLGSILTNVPENNDPFDMDNPDNIPPIGRMLSIQDLQEQQSRQSCIFERIDTLRRMHSEAVEEESKWIAPISIFDAQSQRDPKEMREYFNKFDDDGSGTLFLSSFLSFVYIEIRVCALNIVLCPNLRNEAKSLSFSESLAFRRNVFFDRNC